MEKKDQNIVMITFIISFVGYLTLTFLLFKFLGVKIDFQKIISDVVVCVSILIGLITGGSFSFLSTPLASKFYNIKDKENCNITILHRISKYIKWSIYLGLSCILFCLVIKLFDIQDFYIKVIMESIALSLLIISFESFYLVFNIIFKIFTNNRDNG